MQKNKDMFSYYLQLRVLASVQSFHILKKKWEIGKINYCIVDLIYIQNDK